MRRSSSFARRSGSSPTSPTSNLGNALRRQGKLDEAIAEYREAIRLQPDDHIGHYNLGDILRSQGKLDEAIAEYREAIRLQPDYAYAHSNLGLALLAQGKVDEAIAAHREALRLNPNYHNIPNNLAWALALTPDRPPRDYDEAAALARKAIDLEPKDGDLLQHAGAGGIPSRPLGRSDRRRRAVHQADQGR